jgi:hypothetical protein
MPLTLVRPDISEDKRQELKDYLRTQWLRARSGRQQQVDGDYGKWSKAYEGTPLEEVRTVPFYKASNFVVKLIRVYVDTFTARTLNVCFATQPLYVCEGMPADMRDGYELYLNRKATYDWQHYRVARELCQRGNKNGTVIFKMPWTEKTGYDVSAGPGGTMREQLITYCRGPEALPIPFEDFYLYPITVNRLQDAVIKFHRTRFVREIAEQKVASGEWHLPKDKPLTSYLRHPRDIKRTEQQSDSGVVDPYVLEIHLIEAFLQYPVTNDPSKYYDVVVSFEEDSCDIFDIYFNPYPRNLSIFQDYRPFPREDLFYGESLCAILGQAQEEASRIHNERRDNSTIASSVIFKRRSGSLLPNPSTNWYPGKVFDLEDMDDLDVITVGRNYDDMIQQEDYTYQFSNRLSGIDDAMQGLSQGSMGKRGVYNTSGTLAMLAEGNQRQDTNMRDVREALGGIALCSSRLQAAFDPNDPLIDTLPESAQDGARAALQWIASDKAKYLRLEVKASNAGANREVERQNLMSIAGVLSQYGAQVQQMSQQLLNPQLNPGLRLIMNQIVRMQSGMARRLLKAFDQWDAIDEIPDVQQAIERFMPNVPGATDGLRAGAGGGPETALSLPQPGGNAPPGPGLSGGLLQSLAQMPGQAGGQPI